MAEPVLANPDPDAPQLIGGEQGAPAFQSIEQPSGEREVTPVPRATLVEPPPLDFGAFADLVPKERPAVGGIDFGAFSDLVPPPPVTDTPEADKALAETGPSLPIGAAISAKTGVYQTPKGPTSALPTTPEQVAVMQETHIKNVPIQSDPNDPWYKKAADAASNTVSGFVSGMSSGEGMISLLPPVALLQMAHAVPGLWEEIKEAETTPAGSPERWQAGTDTLAYMATLGLITKGTKPKGKPPTEPAEILPRARAAEPAEAMRPPPGEPVPAEAAPPVEPVGETNAAQVAQEVGGLKFDGVQRYPEDTGIPNELNFTITEKGKETTLSVPEGITPDELVARRDAKLEQYKTAEGGETVAKGIREDEGQVPEERVTEEAGPEEGGANLERQAQGEPISGTGPEVDPVIRRILSGKSGSGSWHRQHASRQTSKPMFTEEQWAARRAERQRKLNAAATVAPEAPQEAGPAMPGPSLKPSGSPAPSIVKPIKSQREIIATLSKGLKIPIRFRRLTSTKAGGYFMPKANLIASREPYDVPVISHEAGHKLDDMFKLRSDPSIRHELDVLGDPKTPGSRSSWTPSKTLKYKHGEGVAEFVRHWLTDPAKAQADAPATHAAFEAILDANKDVGDLMRQTREDIRLWKEADFQARIRSQISVGENPNKTRYTMSQLTRDLVDNLHFMRLAEEDAQLMGKRPLLPSQRPYVLARTLRGSYGMADTFIRDGIADFTTREVKMGTSYEDHIAPVAGRINDFRDWITAKQAKELHAQGKETGLNRADTNRLVAKFENDPDFQKAFAGLQEWQDAGLKYAIDSGLLSAEGAAAMKMQYQDYVPLHRLFEVGAGEGSALEGSGVGRGLNIGRPGSLRQRKGSVRPIVDPLETMVKNMYVLITASEKAAIHNAVGDLANMTGMGKWVERVASPKEAVKVPLERIKEQLEDAGADLSKMSPKKIEELVLTYYKQSARAPYGENIIRVVKGDTPTFYRLDADLFSTFHALDMEDAGKIVRFISAPAQLLRAGVTIEPSFALANAMRDTFNAAVISKYGALPFETTARGLAAMIRNPKLVAEWAASGGKNSIEANYFDRASVQKFLHEKIVKDFTPAERATIWLKSPLKLLRQMSAVSEEATRIGEYQIALNKLTKSGMPIGEARRLAAFESRDRQDFSKGGAKTKILRRSAAFWNAGLQGNIRLAQAFKQQPVRTLLQGAAFITIPKLLEQALNWDNQDYWDRPQWERDLFFLIPMGHDANGHTRFARIPTPFEVGVLFGTLPGRITQYAHDHDPKALTGYFQTLLQQTVPNPIPQSVQAVFEDFLAGKQGWDVYRMRPIVPESLKDLPPELQYTEQTSATAKKVGELLGYSPMKIDHIINQTTGGMGKVLSGQQIPGKRFVTTPLAVSNQQVEDFYNTLDELRQHKERIKAGKAEPGTGLLKDFEKASRRMGELRKITRQSDDEQAKLEAQEQIYQIARRAMKVYRGQ